MSNRVKALIATSALGIVLTILTLSQRGEYSYTKLGGILLFVQGGYVLLLIPAIIVFLVLQKKEIAGGVAISFGIGFFATIVVTLMGI